MAQKLDVEAIRALVYRGCLMAGAPDPDDCAQDVVLRALLHGRLKPSYSEFYWIQAGKHRAMDQHKQTHSRLREGQFTSNEATHTVLPAPDRRTGTRARMIRVVGAKNFKWLLIYGLWGQRHTPAERVRAMRLRDKLRAALR